MSERVISPNEMFDCTDVSPPVHEDFQFKSKLEANQETENINFEMIENKIDKAISQGHYSCGIEKERLSKCMKKKLEDAGYLVYCTKTETRISWNQVDLH